MWCHSFDNRKYPQGQNTEESLRTHTHTHTTVSWLHAKKHLRKELISGCTRPRVMRACIQSPGLLEVESVIMTLDGSWSISALLTMAYIYVYVCHTPVSICTLKDRLGQLEAKDLWQGLQPTDLLISVDICECVVLKTAARTGAASPQKQRKMVKAKQGWIRQEKALSSNIWAFCTTIWK